MKHRLTLALVPLCCALALSGPAAAIELDAFLADINVAARADIGGFRAGLSAQFQLSSGEVDRLCGVFDEPADVYMALRLRDVARVPLHRITDEYRHHRGRGWGEIAKSLGIKPGSPEFHALKQGRVPVAGGRGTASGAGHADTHAGSAVSQGKGKAKGSK